MKTTTALRINQQRLVESLRLSFTNSTTVLGELMQNARRAGAAKVEFDYAPEAGILHVRDDGCGIESIQTLLTVAESGWDAKTVEREHPFGIGFLSALFACDHIVVESKSGRLSANTADILSFMPLSVTPFEWDGVTTLTLSGFKPSPDSVRESMRKMAKGFPIPVLFNGEELRRPWALDSGLEFVKTEIGDVYLSGLGKGEDWLRTGDRLRIFLLGLPVYAGTSYSCDAGNMIHLDASRFLARLPDRDKLVDEDQVVRLVAEVVKREAAGRIRQLKKMLAPADFANGYDTIRKWGCLEVLNDVSVIPARALACIDGYPVIQGGCYDSNLSDCGQGVTQQEVKSGAVRIVELEDFETENSALWMYAWHKDMRVLHHPLDPGHWVFRRALTLDGQAFQVEIVGETHRAYFDGQWVCGEAVFCEKYRVIVGGDAVEITSDSIYQSGGDGDCFIVPKGDVSGVVVQQASSYYEDDSLNESVRDEDEWAFGTFAVANTASNPAEAMRKLLPSFKGCPSVFGRRFAVVLDAEGNVESVAEELAQDSN